MTRGPQYQFIWTSEVDGQTRICSDGTWSNTSPDLSSIALQEIVHHAYMRLSHQGCLYTFSSYRVGGICRG